MRTIKVYRFQEIIDILMKVLVPAEYKSDAKKLYQEGIRGKEHDALMVYNELETKFRGWLGA